VKTRCIGFAEVAAAAEAEAAEKTACSPQEHLIHVKAARFELPLSRVRHGSFAEGTEELGVERGGSGIAHWDVSEMSRLVKKAAGALVTQRAMTSSRNSSNKADVRMRGCADVRVRGCEGANKTDPATHSPALKSLLWRLREAVRSRAEMLARLAFISEVGSAKAFDHTGRQPVIRPLRWHNGRSHAWRIAALGGQDGGSSGGSHGTEAFTPSPSASTLCLSPTEAWPLTAKVTRAFCDMTVARRYSSVSVQSMHPPISTASSFPSPLRSPPGSRNPSP
jgi:hypothetical protein